MAKKGPFLRCFETACRHRLSIGSEEMVCPVCGSLLEVRGEAPPLAAADLKRFFHDRRSSDEPLDRSGVWRFREFLPFSSGGLEKVVTMGEGNTPVLKATGSARYAGLDRLDVKHLGWNPSGSFKDYGMTVAVSQARVLGKRAVACASTGNTSASMAAYAAQAGISAVVFLPEGQIAFGKLAQSLEFGAHTLQVEGNFDLALRMLRELAPKTGLYLVNSLNPFRIEGQKTTVLELLEQCDWDPPDWIALPGGNLGNVSAFGKGLEEAQEAGLIERLPGLLLVQAGGADPFVRMMEEESLELKPVGDPDTLATAIKIGNPVSWQKARKALLATGGVCISVSEQEIADAKAVLGRDGIGCEPASATSLAGVRKLRQKGVVGQDQRVVLILTGHQSKDSEYTVAYHQGELRSGDQLIEPHFSNRPRRVQARPDVIRNELGRLLEESGRTPSVSGAEVES